MELNYTPQNADGSIVLKKQSPLTKHFRFPASSGPPGRARRAAYSAFIYQYRSAMSFVWGEDNVNFLRARYAAFNKARCFAVCVTLKITRRSKMGTVSDGRARSATESSGNTHEIGTDVNYGEITRQLIASLQRNLTSRCNSAAKSAP